MTGRTLEGRTALITGAGRGLGKAMAEGLAARGAKIALVDLERDVLAAAAADVETAGGQGCALVLPADVTDTQRAAEVVEETISSFGSLDILINDAAMGPQFFTEDFTGDGPRFWQVDNDLWLRVLTVNAFGPQLMASAVAPHMVDQGWGRIINVTTSLDTMFLPGCGAYGPSKASLEANTRIMANAWSLNIPMDSSACRSWRMKRRTSRSACVHPHPAPSLLAASARRRRRFAGCTHTVSRGGSWSQTDPR